MTVKQPRGSTSATPSSCSSATAHAAPGSSSTSSPTENLSDSGHNNTNNNNINNSQNNATSSPTKVSKPIPASDWSVVDVQNWFRRKCGDYYHLYSEKLLEQGITGPSLLRLNEGSLLRLGIFHPEHRQAIWREITKLRLRTNIVILRELEREQK